MGVSDAIQLEAQVRCALISEGLCPYCRGPLVIPDRSIRWAVCVPCEVAHRASGNGLDDFGWESRMVFHDDLERLGPRPDPDGHENPPDAR